MATRQMMFLVAVVAAMFGAPQVTKRFHQQFAPRASIHALMAHFCGNEASLFSERAATCRTLTSQRLPWNLEGEDIAILRLCPHQIQEAEHGSWTEQAEGWERAAEMANRASTRHRQAAGLYDLWGCWPVVAPLSLVVLLVVSWFFLRRLDRSRSEESTSRWIRIALFLVVLGIFMWTFQDAFYQSLFQVVRE